LKTATFIILGAGSRGSTYASYALEHPDAATVVGVAEPRDPWRERLVQAHGIPVDNISQDWRELLARPKFADAVVIATQDAMHLEPAIEAAQKGYHILLEKPMAPDQAGCQRIVAAALEAGTIFAVCHVMRYTRHTRKIKELVDGGSIGEVVNVQSLEPVGYWHQAHSYVRGKWRREDESSSMLLAKSCHDLDWIRYIMDSKCRSIQSFGTLKHSRADQKPEGAADRCLDCPCEPDCAYSAKKIYLGRVARGEIGWPADVLAPEVNEASITEALKTGPYGRCVYACDNDVVDNQVVNMLFDGGMTASLTMTAFTEGDHRQTRIFGTRGQLVSDGNVIRHFDFLSDTWEEIDTKSAESSILGGHGGGDFEIMRAFVEAVRQDDPGLLSSGPEETLETHMMVFAAEVSRRQDQVVMMDDMFA